MMQDLVKTNELVSALADGELRGEEFARTVEWMSEAEEARRTWHAYQVVGEVLRSGEAMATTRDAAFMQRFKLGLQQEASRASFLETTDFVAACAIPTGTIDINEPKIAAANDSSQRWKLLAGLASLAMVSVIGWQAWSGWGDQPGAAQLAQGASGQAEVALPQVVGGNDSAVMIRDPQLDALLTAHMQFGGTSALQMPAGFLRNATFEGAAR